MKPIVNEYMTKALGLVAGTALLLGGYAANAQILEEVVVTAQKREQNLQDVPISVTAFSGEQLDSLGFTDFVEITQQVPSLQLNTWSPKLTNFNLRGVSQNTFNDNNEGPIAVYFDDVYNGSLNGLSGNMFDMERVEILRGPQGTLFGRNATGGLIHYVSRDASEAEDNGFIQLEGGEYNRYNAEFGVGGSISDSTRYRFSGRWATMDGYIESVDTPVPPPAQGIFGTTTLEGSGQDLGGVNGYSVRGTIQTDFSDELQGNFWLKYSRDTDVATGGYVFEDCNPFPDGSCPVDEFGRTITTGEGVIEGVFDVPADEHEHFGEQPGFLNREQWSGTARFDYDMNNGMEFVSITSVMTNDYGYDEDGDALGLPILTFQTFVDYSQWSQEFRLAGESDRARWQVGAYYLDMEWDGGTSVTGAPGHGQIVCSGRLAAAGGFPTECFGPTASPFNAFDDARSSQDYVLGSKNWSIFGQADFDLSDALVLTAGLRYSQDEKDMAWRLFFTDVNNPNPVTIETSQAFAAASPGSDEISYGDWAGRLALNWNTSDSTIVFASVNRGIKGGNWSIGGTPNITPESFQHKEEVLYSYELGFKTEWETARLNGTAFYYDYSDYQAFSLAGGGPFISNSDATITGGELELFWYPNENVDVILGGAFVDSEIDEILGAAAIFGGAAGGAVITNAEMPNAPSLSFNYLFRYNWDVANGNVAAQIDGAYYGDQFYEVTNGSGSFQDAYNVSNARLTYASGDDRWSITGWVKNFTDETYLNYALDLGALGTTTYYAPPIMWGGTVRVNW